MPFISQEGLKQLKLYQYKSGGYSYLDNRINPFWEFVVKLLPLWLAPNLITFIGFANMILASAVQVYYDVTMTKDIPSWSFYYMAFSIFAYQTLDAIDGKQARRTKSSSPLGQLFDHGCDSFILTFFIISLAQCCKMDSTSVFYLFLAVQISLWGLNQKEYHTGLLHTHLYNIGVTELELIAIACELVAATLGQNYFHFQVFGIVIYKWITTIILITGTVSNVYIFFSNIKLSKKPMTAFLEWCPFFLFWFLQVKWFEAEIYKEYAGPILINFGIIMSTMVSKMIICSTTRDSFPLFHLEMIPYVVCTALITFIPMQLSTQIQIFQVCFISSIILTLVFLRGVITQITAYLGIHCFTIKKVE